MRIGIFDPYLNDIGGGEKYLLSIAECLSKEHQVHVFWDKKEDLEECEKRFALNLSKVKLTHNIFSPETKTLERLVESAKYDVIVFLSDGSMPWVLSKKLFVHIQQPIKALEKLSFINKLKTRRVDKFFINSKFTESFMDKAIKDKSMIMYPPVVLKPRKTIKENIILHVGRFRLQNSDAESKDFKKQSLMIEVFKKMVDKGMKSWKFILVVGLQDKDIDSFLEIKKSAQNYPIEFMINLENDSLWDLYSKAKIYWHASGFGENLRKNPEYAEHFGISTVEAMGAGCVPVVIDAGGQKEIVEDGKNGFLWNKVEELVDKTELLSQDTRLWSSLSREAKEKAESFTGGRFCREVNFLIYS